MKHVENISNMYKDRDPRFMPPYYSRELIGSRNLSIVRYTMLIG